MVRAVVIVCTSASEASIHTEVETASKSAPSAANRPDTFNSCNSATIKPESYAILDEVGRILAKWNELRVEVGGHTDSQGREAYNQRLSESRAQSVMSYLTEKFSDIDPSQLTAAGYGESAPVASNDDPEGRALNRRVEFKVLNRGTLRQ